MNSWLIGLLLVLVVVIIILSLNIFINITYSKKPNSQFMSVSILIFRRLKVYTYKISPVDFTNRHKKKEPAAHKSFPPKKFAGKFTSDSYYKLIGKLLQFTYFEKLYFKMVYGFEDAALTGMSSGILTVLKGNFLVLFNNYFKTTRPPELFIIPVYGHNRLEVEFNCILRIRLGNVIKVII